MIEPQFRGLGLEWTKKKYIRTVKMLSRVYRLTNMPWRRPRISYNVWFCSRTYLWKPFKSFGKSWFLCFISPITGLYVENETGQISYLMACVTSCPGRDRRNRSAHRRQGNMRYAHGSKYFYCTQACFRVHRIWQIRRQAR